MVQGDSLLGISRKDTVRIAVADIGSVAVRRFDWLKTTGLVALSTGATFGIACAPACDYGPTGFRY